ncbi:MAG: DUF420 domain-containing protein [Cytophagaceae bacterium]|nr:DUF420 domain-containing protein [Cytophagaceae bacterium]
MKKNDTLKYDNLFIWIIGVLSVVVPALVAVLFYVPEAGKIINFDATALPFLNAILNTATATCLIAGFIFIKKGKQRLHIAAMITAFALSTIFLLSYVAYHSQGYESRFGDINHNGVLEDIEKQEAGGLRYVYYIILLTHIVLAAVVVPFVLLSIYFGISRQYKKHTRIVKWTFPIWLYVAITGVLVYLMISPYYPF